MSSFIIIIGNPVDGLRFIGPFKTRTEAVDHPGEHPAYDEDWWVAEVIAPSEIDK